MNPDQEIGQDGDQVDTRTSLEAILSRYGQAADAYANDLNRSSSDYEAMKVNQKYLTDVASVLKSISGILNNKDVYQAASYFEAGAWAYLDNSDQLAYSKGLDGRFALSTRNSGFLRSRLKVIAERAKRMKVLYCREFQDTANPERSILRFMLDLVLELPIGAWECASCLAMRGDCSGCGYGRDHGICSQPGSNFDMLCSSQDAILRSIRANLTEMKLQYGSMSLLKDLEMQLYSPNMPLAEMEIDICGQYDIVEVCD